MTAQGRFSHLRSMRRSLSKRNGGKLDIVPRTNGTLSLLFLQDFCTVLAVGKVHAGCGNVRAFAFMANDADGIRRWCHGQCRAAGRLRVMIRWLLVLR